MSARFEALVGSWGSECLLGLVAAIAGYRVHVQTKGEPLAQHDISFALPDDLGEFRGQITADQAAVRGHWIQPQRILTGDRHATPLEFREEQPGVWSAEVIPLDERLSLYVVISQQSDGSLVAHVYNPERNLGHGTLFRLSWEGSTIRFTAPTGTQDDLHGRYDQQSDSLILTFRGLGMTLSFTRRNHDTAPGLYPRSTTWACYRYSPPPASNDGWRVAFKRCWAR